MTWTHNLSAALESATGWLALAAWVGWIMLGSGCTRAKAGDINRDQGTRAWAEGVTLGTVGLAIGAAVILPWGQITGPPWITRVLGSTFAILGIALRQWAIITLGRFFTQSLMIRAGHQLVTSGPYRFVRHPGYAGTLATLVGLGLTLGHWMSLGVMAVGFFLAHLPRIRAEERVLEECLGEQYRVFERTRKRLIPGIW